MRFAIMLVLLSFIASHIQAASMSINLVPCGPVSPEVLSYLEDGLGREFGAEVMRQSRGISRMSS